MDIQYSSQMPAMDSFHALFESTGWNREYQATPEELILAVTNSQFVVNAYDGEKLVGFGRVVTDGVLHAMIYDMIILPSYQNRGIGSRILNLLVNKCREANIRDIQLFCAQNKQGFYEKHGFSIRPADAPGMQYRKK